MDRAVEFSKGAVASGKKYVDETTSEIVKECFPSKSAFSKESFAENLKYLKSVFHVPYSPAYVGPGWFMKLLYDEKNTAYYEGLYGDVFAGFTVGMTLIPQGLSYSTLARLPPINGLYTVILPSVCYTVLGSGMVLSVGPVALVSLLMGELLTKRGLDSTVDPEGALNYAAQACLCSGILMFLMGLFNMGNLIRFISYPVMSGFTTASACIIGLNQIKNGFGFPSSANVPQVGGSVEYNYQLMKWYMENWNGRDSAGYLYRNVHATNIMFGIYVPLALLWYFKSTWKPSAATKKTVAFQVYSFIAALATLIALIIAGHEAYLIHNDNNTFHGRSLKVVGDVPAGLDIFNSPTFDYSFGTVFVDVIPLTIIAYMEGFAVARKTAATRGQLSFLNPSQELVALGVGNLLNSVASGYPVSGSFSRSSLNMACGAISPLSNVVTLVIILVALGVFTKAFYFIPLAALSAVVMVAVLGLIDFHEFWTAWKLSKKDFLVMFSTFVFTFIYDTEIGLGIGIALSIVLLLKDLAYSLESKPISKAINYKGVEIIRLNSNLVFVSAETIKSTLINEVKC
jgi:sulfate permease, SulP family